MLSTGPGSSCDVCFEKFGLDRKAPTSIACGHIFCNSCISQISHLCPMCRTPFDVRMCIKLHIDIDEPGCSPEDLKVAQNLQKQISSIADEGITEPRLRLLIQEGRTFLHSQPRNLHKDLRAAHRMISYLCEVKATLRSQNQAVETLKDQIAQLTQEKADLHKQVGELEASRRCERETALAVETTLREHCDNSVKLYHSTVELYNKVAKENAELILKLSAHLTSGKQSERHDTDSIAPTPSTLPSLLSPVVDQKILRTVGIPDPHSSFLISPLPQFTSNLPSVTDSFVPLPDLAEDDEGEEGSTEDEDEGLLTPDSAQHQPQLRESKDYLRVSATIPQSSSRSDGRISHEPSGLSRTAPYREHHGRARSRSNPSQPTSRTQSRSHSPFDSFASSTPPMSPLQNNVATVQPQGTYQVPSRETHASSSQTPVPQHQQVLRTRLQDILSDTTTSSSLPNMTTSHFPTSFTNRDTTNAREGRVSPPPSRTSPSNSASKTPVPLQQSSSDNFSHLLASGSQSFSNKPAPSVSPNPQGLVGPRISTASAAATKLEEERRRKHKEEKYGQPQSQEYDRNPTEADRDARWPKTVSASTAPPAGQAARRDQQPYGNPLHSNTSSTSSLRRGPSITSSSTYGRSSGSGLAPSHEQQPVHQGRYSSSPMPTAKASTKNNGPVLPANPAGIYT